MIIGAQPRAVQALARLLAHHTGQQLSDARRWRIETSLRPLLREERLHSLDELVMALDREPRGALLAKVLDTMLNHESSFFRDMAVFQSIEQKILPVLRERARDRVLRVWCAGCSTGQEVFSLAMMIKRVTADWEGWRVSVLGTDVSSVAIETAKRGRFSQLDMQRGLPINELLRWFDPVADQWQIRNEIRDMVSFKTDNLLEPRVASGQYDLVLCRNVLFYLSEQNKRSAWAQLARHVRPGGYLVLGAAETMVDRDCGFTACRDLRCVYCAGSCNRDCGHLGART